MRTVEEHIDLILASVPRPDSIELALLDAQGLLCAEEVVSEISLPSFDQTAVEGYAARNVDISTATTEDPAVLAVVGEADAGARSVQSIAAGMAVRVTPGAILPAGADLVVPMSWTDRGVARVAINRVPPQWSFVRRTGDDVAPGDTAVSVGTPIGPAQVGLLAAVGRDRIHVRPRPRVVVVSTGDELIDVGISPGVGEIVDVNSYALAAAARDAGAEVYRAGIVSSDKRRLLEMMESQLLRGDILVISGSFGTGTFDVVQEVLGELGDMDYARVGMTPAAAQGFGRLGSRKVPTLCVPSDPVSALVSFEVFVRPAIRLMLGKRQLFRRSVDAVCGAAMDSPPGRRQYRQGRIYRHPDGGYVADPVGQDGTHLLLGMAQANCLIVLSEDQTHVPEGGQVTAMPLLLTS
ncbi:MAG: molybdopterin molybdotransferase MoeA [Geodermatophilaceae bacterium]|nr:molybdopterin molybdotransferase MoeA [Geodermatophilaceae bacterium]